jgi:hypothetical protein
MSDEKREALALIEKLKSLQAKSSQVGSWYAHRGGDCYGPEATVRGPYFRWFKCADVEEQYRKHVAEPEDDVKYAAAAMNHVPELIKTIEARDEEVKRLMDCLKEAQKALVGGTDLGGVFWRDIAIARIAGVIEHESGGSHG